MATEGDSSQLSENFSKLDIKTAKRKSSPVINAANETLEYGLPLKEVYKLAFSFYKGK
jgi:hypothetical protein